MLIVNESPDNCIFLYRNENNPRYPITLVDISVSEKYHLDMSEESAADLGNALLDLCVPKRNQSKKDNDEFHNSQDDNESKLGSAPIMDKKLRDLIKNVYDSLR